MAELFHNGLIVDLILVLMVLESLALIALRQFWAKGPSLYDWLPNLVSGACLLLALRAIIAQSTWLWVAFFLTLSLLAHLADLARRF